MIALTGSNPLHETAMAFIKTQGLVVFLDVSNEDIIQRLSDMKVDRIVGQGKKSFDEILNYR